MVVGDYIAIYYVIISDVDINIGLRDNIASKVKEVCESSDCDAGITAQCADVTSSVIECGAVIVDCYAAFSLHNSVSVNGVGASVEYQVSCRINCA